MPCCDVATDLPTVGAVLGPLSETALNAAIGVGAGAVVLAGVKAFGSLKRRFVPRGE